MAWTQASRTGIVELPALGDSNFISRPLKIKTGTIATDSSYAGSGGEAVDLNDEFTTLLAVIIPPKAGYVFEYVVSTGKVIAYWVDTTTDGAVMAEVAATTNISTLAPTLDFIAIGFG